MCSMDRIENTNCSQLDFFREMQLTVNLSSHPACIRLRDGSFSHFNHSFATTFLHNINVNIWFNRLEISSSLRLSALDAEVYSGDRKMLIEENLPINGNRWDFIIERMSFDGTEFTLWKFCHLQRGGFLLSPVRSGFIKKLNEFKNALGFLTDVQIETLALYSFGASHNQISEVLNIAVGTSKNRVKEGANKQVISSQADSLIKISRIWADFFPANTSNQPI
ncbi:conjugal transfer protein TraJ [Klebsiella pneumoniae]|uniref:conjugal transfer protein TraJ n=1 Tax=Klebsiella pneumoniae TaxID=573 RepID=UPI0020CCD2C1|nr:conjugal transfer protein TraJ [Klebsiella pneumoniae]WDO00029.1 conjugal transfer protein TraJ [Klebsiella pneumoniae subsp. pneumoniae]